MSEQPQAEPPTGAPTPAPPGASHHDGHVKVRKRIRVRTLEGEREHRHAQWEKVRNILLYIGIGIVGLLMIWFGLRMFVTDPPLPKQAGVWPAGVTGRGVV